jgi:hypothetical protein
LGQTAQKAGEILKWQYRKLVLKVIMVSLKSITIYFLMIYSAILVWKTRAGLRLLLTIEKIISVERALKVLEPLKVPSQPKEELAP